MPAEPQARCFPALRASLLLTLGAALGGVPLPAQQPADTSQQAPAPVVRVHPRPQTSVPAAAPQDAAPLAPHANHVPRIQRIDPQALSGVGGAKAATGTATTAPLPRPAHTSPAATTGTQPAPAATGTLTVPHVPRPPASPATTGVHAASGATATSPSTATATPSSRPTPLSTTGLNRSVVVLDPSHGGPDSGSRIGDNTLEKNITLALAFRLRSLLVARGFTVVMTRDSDTAVEPNAANTPLTLDERAGIANHDHPAACLLLHATGRGNGVHLYTTELDAAVGENTLLPWLTAQAAWVPASQQLERSISSALGRSHIALVSNTASVRPMDSLTCPALVLELAPESSDPRTVNDAGYQERVAAAVAGALVFWQNQVQPPPRLTLTPTSPHPRHRHTAAPTAATSGALEP